MMNNYSEKYLNKIVLVFIFVMGLSGCGGGGDSAPQQNPPVNDPSTLPISNPIFQSITGAGIKGPLANAVVTIFAFDATRPGYKGAVVTTAATDATAAITGLNLPLPLNPPYIMEFTSVPATTDITTGTSPVITTIRTVITQALLAGGKDIYATPLTTLAVDIAVMNATDTNGTAGIQVDEFEAALALAASKVISTLGFGLNSSVDIFDTPPLINSATISTAEQAKVAAYRTAIEAITAIAYQISQQSPGATADTVLADLAADLADNDIIDGSSGGVLNANTLQVLQQIPSSLPIPNTSPVQTIADVQAILAAETAITGSATNTTRLIDGTIVTQATPVRTNVDTDGDGVFNADDDLPDNQFESVDSDGDGIGDNADPDDDNDGILDEDEGLPSTPAENDTDGDGVVNGIDNCRDDFNPAQTNSDNDAEGDACDLDDDGDGVNDVDDAFPNDASKFIDTDSDGIDDGADADDDNDGIDDGTDVGVSQDGSTSCSLLIDCDGDGVLDGADADRTDPNVGLNFAPIANNDNAIVNEGQSVNIDLAFNDTDDNNALDLSSIVITSAPSNGTLVLNADGTVDYTHDGSETITDSFTYNIADTSGAVSNVATVSLEVSVISIDVIADASVNENSVYTGVTPVITGTPIGAVTYTLSGTDAADFTINASTGVVSMVARDFELPVDADVNNVYALTIIATDTN